MHLQSYSVRNYRRLHDVHVDLAHDVSVFVGANNSGKTSATQIIATFVSGSKDKITLYDFNSVCWNALDDLGNRCDLNDQVTPLPCIGLDLWFEVGAEDLYLVIPLLPSTQWRGTQVGIRVEFAAKNRVDLLAKFWNAQEHAQLGAATLVPRENDSYVPWPRTLTDYLGSELQNEFEFKYSVLDRARFDDAYKPEDGYVPPEIVGEPGGASILRSIVSVDSLGAQRHLADPSASAGASSGRSEDLSRRLSRFYKRNLEQRGKDHFALRALYDSEAGLNTHFAEVFKDTLNRLSKLGYPGLHNPQLEIKSALNPATLLSNQDARIHYVLGDEVDALRLPDSYNGLGLKNLIYMVVEILDLHARWSAEKEQRTPLHLVLIEEPEAHLHAQLQQVFIRNILELVSSEDVNESAFHSQFVVTTHSPHIVYERGFEVIRYFRRQATESTQTTEVLNLSSFYRQYREESDFLQRYLKLTHCDLFFADAVILVEGNVERLLLPVMIEKEAITLRSVCLCILEVGGAFAHRFKTLLGFLGLATLVITDLDSVTSAAPPEDDEEAELDFMVPSEDAGSAPVRKSGKACLPSTPDALTSNQTLIQWLPRMRTIAQLLAASDQEKAYASSSARGFNVRVAYQVATTVEWGGTTAQLCARTLEVAFGLENAQWCQSEAQSTIGLRLRRSPDTPAALAEGLHVRVGSKSFDKTRFALGVLTAAPDGWSVPSYIREGLGWLARQVSLELSSTAPVFVASMETIG